MIKQCKWCGKEYETNLYWWNFCCEECHDAYRDYKDHRLIECAICGRPFHPIRGNQRYCSPKCADIAQKRQHRKNYLDNREERINRTKEWCRNNKDKRKRYSKKYYENHKEQVTERKKQYRRENKEKLNAYQRNYYKTHKEEIRARNCKRKHNGCYDCDMPVGECRYD